MALAVALGAVLRLADPLSSPVIPAEDPYNHMALVREHLRTGELEGLYEGQTMYPPGLHAFLAAAWVYTGADLYGLMRFGPVVLGTIGVLGMALLLWRGAGPVAAVVGALAIAVAPEAIFRTTMMSPTALDLAVLPFFFYALLRVLAGRIGWAGVALPMVAFFALAHPWLLAILGATGIAFLVLCLLFSWPATRAAPLTTASVAAAIAVLGIGVGIALLMPEFGDTVGLPVGTHLPTLGISTMAIACAPAAVLLRWRDRTRADAWLARGPPHVLVRAAASLTIAAALAATLWFATRDGLPEFVDLPHMIGWPILVLAAAGLVALPFIASPVANLGAALAVATLPFTLFNPLRSEFLPHRTAIFLGLALVVLCGVAAGALARAAGRPLAAFAAVLVRRPAAQSAGRSRPLWLASVPALLVAALLSGSIYTGTPDAYDGGWYRLYPPCELDALKDVAAQANADPDLLLVTGSWQGKLVLAALTEDATRVAYIKEVFTMEQRRTGLEAQSARDGHTMMVVVERHLAAETPEADLTFTQSPPWEPAGSWCANQGVPQPRVTAFRTEAST